MLRSSLTSEAAETLVYAFVSSRLDYCNTLLCGISDGLLTKLKTVQNATARVVTGPEQGSFDHVHYSCAASTPLGSARQRSPSSWRWSPTKCLHCLAPSYLSDVCIPDSSVVGMQLRSADSGPLVVPRTGTTTGRRDFSVGSGDMEQPPRRTADFNSVHRDICTKTQRSSLWLLAPLRTGAI